MEKIMSRIKTLIVLLIVLLTLAACGETTPQVDWELSIDGDVNQNVTYDYQDLIKMPRAQLKDILTRNPENPDERVSWKGVTLFQLLQEPGGVEFDIGWSALITLDDGSRYRMSLADLRGALVALQDGQGNWLAETAETPVRLIAPNKPSSSWLQGPVRITISAP
jgi:DMSO/TMAO reductase YedYZ molybdopterin-dependent catalytic subunit